MGQKNCNSNISTKATELKTMVKTFSINFTCEKKDRGLQWWYKCLFHILEVWHAAVSAHCRSFVFLLLYCIKHCSYMSCITHVDDNLALKNHQQNNRQTLTYSIKLLSHYTTLCIPLLQGTGFTLTFSAWGNSSGFLGCCAVCLFKTMKHTSLRLHKKNIMWKNLW